MKFCSSCGHELGVGRFCTNCGQPIDRSAAAAGPVPPAPPPVDVRDETGERRAARRNAALAPQPPRTPPSADDKPVPPRFPLYADEVDDGWATDWASGSTTGTAADLPAVTDPASLPGGSLLDRFTTPPPGTRTPDEALAALHAAAHPDLHVDDDDDLGDDLGARRGGRWPWLAGLLVLAVAVGLLVWLGTRDEQGDDTAGSDAGSPSSAEPASLTGDVEVTTPGNAPPSRETGGGRSTFVGANMLDGEPTTAWRVAGSAQGEEVVFTFPAAVTISQVGMINGYAKTGTSDAGQRLDWYHGNRTIAKAEWVFDDGTSVPQDLERNRRMQTVDVDDVTTTTLTLRLVAVRDPGAGRARRDFTAISDVTLVGTPAA